jgi:PEP-CTERM motif
VASHWLQHGIAGDVNGDGIINAQDIAEIASNWLKTDSGSGSAAGNTAGVPEPSTGMLAALGVAICVATALRRGPGRLDMWRFWSRRHANSFVDH